MAIDKTIFDLLFPAGVSEWFEITDCKTIENIVYITFQEKNVPPKEFQNQKDLVSKGFKDFTITDFPIRGKRTELTFRRRYWQIEGQPGIIKNNIELSFPGTQLEKEFAVFLKDGGRELSDLAGYLGYTKPPADKTV